MPPLEAIPKGPVCREHLQSSAFQWAMRGGLLASHAHVDHVRDSVVEFPHASCEGLETYTAIGFRDGSAAQAAATDALKDPVVVAGVARP